MILGPSLKCPKAAKLIRVEEEDSGRRYIVRHLQSYIGLDETKRLLEMVTDIIIVSEEGFAAERFE